MVGEDLAARCSRCGDGERRLTDLRHLAQLLHQRREHRAARGHRAARLARRARRRGRARRGGGGARAAARVRRRGGPGADDPPQQGPRVPGRVLPVPVGPDVDPVQGAGVVPRPRDRLQAHDRRRARGPDVQAARRSVRDRAARGGSAPGVRRADARQAPGGDLVGRHQVQLQLAARTPAVRKGRGRRLSGRSATRPRPTRPSSSDFASWPRSAPGRISVERSTLGMPATWSPPVDAPAELEAAAVRPPPRPLVAADLLQRHHRRGARPAGRERARAAGPERRARDAHASGGRRRRSTAGARARVAARGGCRSASSSAPSSTPCSRRPTSPRPTSMRSSPSTSRARSRAARSTWAIPIGSVPGSASGDRDAARAGRRRAPVARRHPRGPARRARVRAAARRRR